MNFLTKNPNLKKMGGGGGGGGGGAGEEELVEGKIRVSSKDKKV